MTKLLIMLLVFQFLPFTAMAGNTSGVLISQVQVAGDTANDEFIELRNYSADSISLSGWSVQYKTSTGTFPLSAKKTLPDVMLPAGGYFLLAHNDYTGSATPDLSYSGFTLSGASTGATIFLSKSVNSVLAGDDPNIIDKLAYGSSDSNSPQVANAPMPSAGSSLLRVSATKNNLADFTIQASSARSSSSSEIEIEEQEEVVQYSKQILITEIMPNPSGADTGNEWVEIYNANDEETNLDDWFIADSTTSITSSSVLKLNGNSIEAKSYLSIPIPEGKFSLNNTSVDSIRLFWPNKELALEVAYSAPTPENQSWCKLENEFKWCKPTPGQLNLTLESIVSETDAEEEQTQTNEVDYSSLKVRIVEIMPDPVGADEGQEYIRLLNAGEDSVNLKDWILDDGLKGEALGSTSYTLTDLKLEPGDEAEIYIPKGKFALNNTSKDGARLFSPDKTLHDSLEYDKAEEGIPISLLAATTELPRTGMPVGYLLFVLLPAFWYIYSYEQTRSH